MLGQHLVQTWHRGSAKVMGHPKHCIIKVCSGFVRHEVYLFPRRMCLMCKTRAAEFLIADVTAGMIRFETEHKMTVEG